MVVGGLLMKVIEYTLKKNPFPDNDYMKEISSTDFCFIDIETTGFSRKNDYVVLIGLLYREDKSYKLQQYFLEDLGLEKELLAEFMKALNRFELIITYNGLSFDYPFIQERAKIHRLPLKLNNLKHIDLYKHIQLNKKYLPIDNYQLKTVEKLLGINRKDEISGSDSVGLYNRYLQNKEPMIKEKILLHNYEDILNLPSITEIFKFFNGTPILVNSLHHSILFDDKPSANFKELTFTFKISDVSLKDHRLFIKGFTHSLGDFREINIFEEHFNFFWSPDREQYQLELFLGSERLPPDIFAYFFNCDLVMNSIKGKDQSISSRNKTSVYNNIIMYINSSLQHNVALDTIPKILKKIFKEYL